jgi:hypothetical protein
LASLQALEGEQRLVRLQPAYPVDESEAVVTQVADRREQPKFEWAPLVPKLEPVAAVELVAVAESAELVRLIKEWGWAEALQWALSPAVALQRVAALQPAATFQRVAASESSFRSNSRQPAWASPP